MKRSHTASICAIAALGGFAGLAGSAQPARANFATSYTLSLSVPSTASVGEPLLVRASGVNPSPAEYWRASWMEIVAIPASVTRECPQSAQDGAGVALGTDGQILAYSLRPNLDIDGNFVNTVGYTPRQPGDVLFCGYSDDGAGLTLARASALLHVPALRPANVAAPSVLRSGRKLVCEPGEWANGVSRYSFRWLVNGRRPGGEAQTLRVSRAIRSRKVRCSVTASNSAGSATAVSRSVRVGVSK